MENFSKKNEYKNRVLDPIIADYLELCGALCIEGSKWCGKTWTSAYHSNSFYFVGDPSNNFSNRRLAHLDPVAILEGETPRMIDEWQEIPSIWDATRALVDKRQKKGQIILTGSATPQTKGVMHSGTGRIVSVRMDTMSSFESGDSVGTVSLKDLCQGKLNTHLIDEVSLENLAYLIVRGGFPQNINVAPEKAHVMPRKYMDTVIKEDLNKLDDGVYYDKQKVQLLLKSLARNESTTASELAIFKDITNNDTKSLSRNTLSKYLRALERLFLFSNQEPFSPNCRSSLRVKQSEKRHFSDPSMVAAMLNMTQEKLMRDLETFGFLFESLVERDLRVYAQALDGKVYHYQDYKNNEIDAIVELPDGEWCAFEIKLGAKRIDEGAENLVKVCDDIVKAGGTAPRIKCVLCGLSNAAYKREDGVFVVPIGCLKP